ncbi:hypothetical protein PTSG_09140 [Salpingoeca rosetta]|uniref:Uncharacterized protein n=1 Tax=Salpingoeca rosetta (strain ATCC 50818 / BSB-021) TaxID=946362 RepID=F2UMU6_SALR5|nr:uncharacterized protein PTSG_09140 [Salpingoeca rosetta]EGD78445.1 hypothetical protein PTSG_09140 [Salpingoeca rosetta]|eukprot:XP_004989394.1 hypothetical protein PTSG_09140 [Salpingoeca rosetta]
MERARRKAARTGGKMATRDLPKEVAVMLGCSAATVKLLLSKWNRMKREAGKRPNSLKITNNRGTSAKPQRVPFTERVTRLVRDFTTQAQSSGRVINATQLTKHLIESGVLSVKVNPLTSQPEHRDLQAARRATQRFLVRSGYLQTQGRDERKARPTTHLDKLADYLHTLFKNRERPPEQQLREVYLDEAYVQAATNDSSVRLSTHDPSHQWNAAEQEKTTKTNGPRMRVVLAIQNRDPRSADPSQPCTPQQQAGIVEGTAWVADPDEAKRRKGEGGDPTTKNRKKRKAKMMTLMTMMQKMNERSDSHTTDDSKAVDTTSFRQYWVSQLLPSLHQPSLIIMDHAAHRKLFPLHIPYVAIASKADLLGFLTAPPTGAETVEEAVAEIGTGTPLTSQPVAAASTSGGDSSGGEGNDDGVGVAGSSSSSDSRDE